MDIVTPSMRFDEVISTYGYPLIGKEVAEAIYYARRIRSQSGNVERERERVGQQRGSSTNCQAQGNGASADQHSGKAVTQRLQNRGGQNDLPSATVNRQAHRQTNSLIETSTARNRRTVLMGKMDGAREPEEVPG